MQDTRVRSEPGPSQVLTYAFILSGIEPPCNFSEYELLLESNRA
jgi:hypothetical protein